MTNLASKVFEQEVSWPAILALAGENELGYFENYQTWANDPDINSMLFTQGDRLIDVSGRVFNLWQHLLPNSESVYGEKRFSLAQLAELVRAHESQLGACCVAKMVISDFKQGFEAVKLSLKDH